MHKTLYPQRIRPPGSELLHTAYSASCFVRDLPYRKKIVASFPCAPHDSLPYGIRPHTTASTAIIVTIHGLWAAHSNGI